MFIYVVVAIALFTGRLVEQTVRIPMDFELSEHL